MTEHRIIPSKHGVETKPEEYAAAITKIRAVKPKFDEAIKARPELEAWLDSPIKPVPRGFSEILKDLYHAQFPDRTSRV